jgi:phosphoenolpyruvate carboxykinase (ATP)
MLITGIKNPAASLGLHVAAAHWNETPERLVKKTLELGQGVLSDSGALCVNTGRFTGRSPKDRYIVKDSITEKTVNWGSVNIPVSEEIFDRLYSNICNYFRGKEIWVRDAQACADPAFRLKFRVINETPWANLFCHHLFLRPSQDELLNMQPEWTIVQAPGYEAGQDDGTRQENFSIINFSKKIILIGGSAYTGEIKKSVFSVLNFLLPVKYNVLPMHCSANEGHDGQVALFFGLSGTGKTTLSADPDRALIGDDEHGWSDDSVFNFEGGCYAKVINLSKEKEPQIYEAIKQGSLLENIIFHKDTDRVDYSNTTITENTRTAYPIYHVRNAREHSTGREPAHIFFLTCDASGVLPPISRLSKVQAMYHFLSGYTSKVAGTEVGIVDPQTTFSACFGEVFLPLDPIRYAEMLGNKLEKNPDIQVWLINTGWSGGPYGEGIRISLNYTRRIIAAALRGELTTFSFQADSVFGFWVPTAVTGVPAEILNPRNTWRDKTAFDHKANELAGLFIRNFSKYEQAASEEILTAAPIIK